MITHKATVTINKPTSDVFKFVATDYFTNHPKWDPRVVELHVDSTGPVAVGTRGREVRKQGGRNNTYAFEVTDFQANKSMAFKATSGGANFSFSYAFKTINNKQTQLDVALNLRMGGVMRLFEPLMVGSFKKEADTTISTIKSMVEK